MTLNFLSSEEVCNPKGQVQEKPDTYSIAGYQNLSAALPSSTFAVIND
jgi:hypothetical protein